ncbi:hypothetical protein AV530_017561 [Patagioenas fasciata monilis]|uniref:Uncharacterized protein n=1 Tax=Patagioenas fasciata monilis TaxID=372326 RepID=A0A1V4KYX6_PATFA|nr:hypothetical protein AV530_017561 [Patagioenas fasciata monilis]
MSPFTNTLLQWLPDEPSDAGFCGYLAEPSQQGLKAATCINEVNGSICERPGDDIYSFWVSRGVCWLKIIGLSQGVERIPFSTFKSSCVVTLPKKNGPEKASPAVTLHRDWRF